MGTFIRIIGFAGGFASLYFGISWGVDAATSVAGKITLSLLGVTFFSWVTFGVMVLIAKIYIGIEEERSSRYRKSTRQYPVMSREAEAASREAALNSLAAQYRGEPSSRVDVAVEKDALRKRIQSLADGS